MTDVVVLGASLAGLLTAAATGCVLVPKYSSSTVTKRPPGRRCAPVSRKAPNLT